MPDERAEGAGDARGRADTEKPPRSQQSDASDRAAADRGEPVGRVLVQACIECGREFMFEGDSPDDLTCDRCGNTVFRAFYADARPGDEEADFEETTGRDLAADAGASDVAPGDLYDLNNP